MSPEETKRLAGLWAMYGAYYRTKLDDQVLLMYAEDMADQDFNRVNEALQAYRRDPRNRVMPLPSMILALLDPQVDPEAAARAVAGRIAGAVVKFGWCNEDKARAFIGETGWRIIDTRGGWMHLCQNLGVTIDPTAFEAQVREQAKGAFKYGDFAIAQALEIRAGTKTGELQSVRDIMKLITEKKETEP